MPFRDGTGPVDQGTGTGRGFGRGGGRGRQPGGFGLGPSDFCVCTNPDCQHKVPHQRGVPCYEMKCEKCGSPMTREQ